MELITAIGNNKDLVLQFIDFFCKKLPYNTHGNQIKASLAGRPLERIHLITTTTTSQLFNELVKDIEAEQKQGLFKIEPPKLREIPLDMEDIATPEEEEKTRKLIHNAIQEISSRTDLIIASAGRKIITQSLIEAGLLYGCMGYFSITAPYGKEKREYFADFNISWMPLKRLLEEKKGFSDLNPDLLSENFRSLYLLPLNHIQRMQERRIGIKGDEEQSVLAWLQKLPKAELHCHLGGEVQPNLLKQIGLCIVQEDRLQDKVQSTLSCLAIAVSDEPSKGQEQSQEIAVSIAKKLLSFDVPLKDYGSFLHKASLACDLKPYQVNACFLSACTEKQLEDLMWQGCQDAVISLARYMAIGNLGGSNLLQTESAIRMTLESLLQDVASENIRYIEVRCSPENYTQGGISADKVMQILMQTTDKFCATNPKIKVNFIIMATRHKDIEFLKRHVNLAISFTTQRSDDKISMSRVCGFDLAGEEEFRDFAEFRGYLKPLNDNFIQITIHAGEVGEDVRIRDAIYELNARRIGHGLKLVRNPAMMDYARDTGISVEMCPTSNSQTNSYVDFSKYNSAADSQELSKHYPLKAYLQHGIDVTINTDNRGISRTTLSQEYLKAAQITDGGLSQWEVLQIIKNGFKAAFLPLDEKNRLIREIDREVFRIVLDGWGMD